MITIDFTKKYSPTAKSACFVIPGDPIPWARARTHKGKFWDSQKQFKLNIGLLLSNQHGQESLFAGPLAVRMLFCLPIPPSRAKQNLKHVLHSQKPDLSNLVKFIEDTATGILYHDDCLIASLEVQKRYDDNPRTELYIAELYEEKNY